MSEAQGNATRSIFHRGPNTVPLCHREITCLLSSAQQKTPAASCSRQGRESGVTKVDVVGLESPADGPLVD